MHGRLLGIDEHPVGPDFLGLSHREAVVAEAVIAATIADAAS